MKIAIVDDLQSDRMALKEILTGWLAENRLEEHICTYADGETFLREFEPERFAIVFLDILLGEGKENGIAVARQIRELDEEQPLVFTTTERGFALDGFSVQALDYLVKPFEPEQVASVMKRALKIRQPSAYMEIREGREIKRIPLGAIFCVATANRAVEIHTAQGTFRTYMTLEEVKAQIQDSRFVCCSRGVFVNLDQVRGMEEQDFLLYSGERLPISRAKRAEMKDAYTARLFTRTRRGEL